MVRRRSCPASSACDPITSCSSCWCLRVLLRRWVLLLWRILLWRILLRRRIALVLVVVPLPWIERHAVSGAWGVAVGVLVVVLLRRLCADADLLFLWRKPSVFICSSRARWVGGVLGSMWYQTVSAMLVERLSSVPKFGSTICSLRSFRSPMVSLSGCPCVKVFFFHDGVQG